MLASRSDYAVFTKVARWGADSELEACCELMDDWGLDEADLRAARRPKPPSLKEQALAELDRIPTHDNEGRTWGVDVFIIRRALEALPE
jgi:hypothetical protein